MGMYCSVKENVGQEQKLQSHWKVCDKEQNEQLTMELNFA